MQTVLGRIQIVVESMRLIQPTDSRKWALLDFGFSSTCLTSQVELNRSLAFLAKLMKIRERN